jgi:manganese/iron transport system permease protein
VAAAFLDLLGPPYLQRAVAELLLLSVLAGVLGSWIVLRRLAFYSHAVGTAAFPGLVVAAPLALPPQVAALGTGLLVAGGVSGLSRARGLGAEVATGLVLVAALAAGVILASDVYESGSGVDRLLFGSLLSVSDRDVWLTALACAAIAGLEAACRRSWLLQALDPEVARAGGVRVALHDRLLLGAVAVGAIVALDAVGALMVSAILVVPAATARLVTRSVPGLRRAAALIAAGEGVVALVLARELDVGPGAVLAVLSATVFALVATVARR